MIYSVASLLSSLQAARKSLDISAGNTANANTDGYKAKAASQREGAGGAVTVTITNDVSPGPVYEKPGLGPVEASNVDYAREAVGQITARRQVDAVSAAIKTYDETLRNTIDILA